jgi:hypothetical protein
VGTHLDHAEALLVVSSGDLEHVSGKLVAEAFTINSLQYK